MYLHMTGRRKEFQGYAKTSGACFWPLWQNKGARGAGSVDSSSLEDPTMVSTGPRGVGEFPTTPALGGRLGDLPNREGVHHASGSAPVSHLAIVRLKCRTEGPSEEATELLRLLWRRKLTWNYKSVTNGVAGTKRRIAIPFCWCPCMHGGANQAEDWSGKRVFQEFYLSSQTLLSLWFNSASIQSFKITCWYRDPNHRKYNCRMAGAIQWSYAVRNYIRIRILEYQVP